MAPPPCTGARDLFYAPEYHGTGYPDTAWFDQRRDQERAAVKLCRCCSRRFGCLADALDRREEYGVWGGMTERQRRAVLARNPGVTSWREYLRRRMGEVA